MAHSSISNQLGSTGAIMYKAVAISSTPKKALTPSIHPPARGSRVPAPRPTSSSGTLMPAASANSATPPISAFPVWLM